MTIRSDEARQRSDAADVALAEMLSHVKRVQDEIHALRELIETELSGE